MRDCKNCKHLIMYDYKNKSYSCEARECEFEPEEPTKNDLGDDLVSRADVKRAIEDVLQSDNCDYDLKDFLDDLVDIPSVILLAPKTGHWIFVGEENEEETKAGNFRYVCSECGFTDVHGKSTYVPYCWQCGAKMAESEVEDAGISD